jgi:hypothetical protein
MPRITNSDLLITAKSNQSDLLASKKIALALIASNEAKLLDIRAALASAANLPFKL